MYTLSGSTSKVNKTLEDMAPMLKDLNISIQEEKAEQLNQKKTEEALIAQLLDEGVQTFSRTLSGVATTSTSLKRNDSKDSSRSVGSTSTTATSASSPMTPTKPAAARDENDSEGSRLSLIKMESYMLKRSSGARKNWSRRYFILNLQECRLDYLSPKDSDTPIVAVYLSDAKIMEVDFDDRRYVLHIVSPTVYGPLTCLSLLFLVSLSLSLSLSLFSFAQALFLSSEIITSRPNPKVISLTGGRPSLPPRSTVPWHLMG